MKRYEYSCANCGGAVNKPRVKMKESVKGTAPEMEHGLGGWKCLKCGPGVKVARKLL